MYILAKYNEAYYDMVKYNNNEDTSAMNKAHRPDSQETPHSSPYRVSYGVSIVSICIERKFIFYNSTLTN